MDRETAHKLLDLVFSSNHEGITIEFKPPCGKGYACAVYIHEWDGDDIVSSRSYYMVGDVWWGNKGEKYTTEEIMEVLEGLQDAEH